MSTPPMGPNDFINQMEPWIDDNEVRHMTEYLSSGGWLTEFKKTAEFEEMVAAYTGAKHCIIVANGTVSMSVAYWALGIGPGDEVLVPDVTMIATPNAVRLVGATPVLVDVEAATLCMDLERAAAAITPRTKAVALVSLNGRAPDMHAWRTFCDARGLVLMEDAAQSLGSRQGGTHLGRFGQVGSFSFSAPKIITTGQGGALITDDDALALRMRKIKDFGRVKAGVDWHDMMGQNFKTTDVQSVLGIEQMKKLPWRVERKKAMYRRYEAALSGVNGVGMLRTSDDTAPWFMDVYVDDPAGLREHLHTRGIGSRPVYPAVHRQSIYAGDAQFPVAERFCSRGLWLPSSSFLDDATIDRVTAGVRAFVSGGTAS
ncbi:MAG: DegT/DnrJ/EryC1/StrS family aminotransferase [Gemmatimonadota bacterium]|nr:DegT/DnrJ/EryC1/StrS family aminotransferase [Gemmatimonadota bacterium]